MSTSTKEDIQMASKKHIAKRKMTEFSRIWNNQKSYRLLILISLTIMGNCLLAPIKPDCIYTSTSSYIPNRSVFTLSLKDIQKIHIICKLGPA